MQLKKPGIEKKIDVAIKFAADQAIDQSKIPGVPTGSIRATMNINAKLYKKLKIRAAEEGVTIRVLIERMIEAYLK